MQHTSTSSLTDGFLSPDFERIPDLLKGLRWGVWIAEPRPGQPGKFNKAPRSPLNGRKSPATNPSLFGTFEEAVFAYGTGHYTGVGVILDGSGVIAIDIDDVSARIRQNSGLGSWLAEALGEGVYCEFSPSNTGLHLYLIGTLPDGRGRKGEGLEVYSTRRFMTVTGHTFRGLS